MRNVLANAIASALKPANFRAASDEPTDDETVDDDTGNSTDDEKQAEDDDKDSDAEDTTSDDANAGNSADDDDKKPDAAAVNSALAAVRVEERQRCIAIFSHPNAEGSPKLAAKLLVDGTSQQQAVSLLDSVEANPGTNSGNSLAERVHASQGNKKPGQDKVSGNGGSGKASEGDALVASASKNFGQKKASRQRHSNH